MSNPPSNSGSSSPVTREPSQIGSYRLLQPLGSGGMSNVYRAVHVDSGHEVAIKILPRALARNGTMLRRFLRETKCAESLQDPHIVEIYDHGCEAGRHYIVLEYLPGGDLQDLIHSKGPLPIERALSIIRDAVQGLRHAASRGLIHRDIKPANLLLTSDGRVKVTDLGLALQLEDDEQVTRAGTTVGTVDYMSPEQARDSHATTVRSDIYSLGCTLYYLLTARQPFLGGDLPEKLRKHAQDPAPDVRELCPEATEDLARFITRMMAKKPERRFVDYDHLLMALDELMPTRTGAAATRADSPRAAVAKPKSSAAHPAIEPWLLHDGPLPVPTEEWPTALAPPNPPAGASSGAAQDTSAGYQLGPLSAPNVGPASTRSSPAVRPAPMRPDFEPPRDIDLVPLREAEHSEPRIRAVSQPGDSRPPSSAKASSPAPGRSSVRKVTYAPPDPPPLEVLPEPVVPLQTGEPSPLLLTRFLQAMLALIALAFLAIGIQNLGAWLGTRRPVGSGSQESNNAVITADTVDEPSARALLIPRETPAPDPIIDQPWSEPREVEKPPQVRPSYPPEAVARLGLEGVLEGEDPRPPSPTVQVYRTAWGRDRNQAESIRRALDFPSGTVEIRDDGPLYEEDLHFGGLYRWIRNAPGYRPMIVVPRLSNPAISRRSALLRLEGKDLVLEGLDFVIDASDLTSAQSSIFECRGSRLTLRDCTFTLHGFSNRPIALVAVVPATESANARESRVRIERTLVRGAGVSAVRIEGGPSRVEIVESIALTSQAPTLVASITDAQSLTRIDIAGCLLASDSPVVEIGGDASRTSRAVRLSVLQSALIAQCGIAAPPQLVAFAVNSELPDAQVYEWIGAHNVYAGWAASRSAVSSDVDGRVLTHGLAPGALHPWIRAADVAEQLPEVGPFISSTAQPHPNLQAWSSNFERLPSDEAPGGPESHGQSLEFDADASPFAGDLGRFLSESVNPTARQIRVTVAGSGRKWMTPIRLRDGVSLVIEVKSPPPGEPSLEWTWSEETAAPALIMARLANLTIRGARFARDAHPSVPQIVRVEHGNLTLDRCSLIAPWLVDDGGGGLVAFLTDGTRGLDDPPVASLDGCVLITGGVAVLADVGAGRVRIEHCGIAAGQAALELGPQDVSPGRFHADLLLDHCTLFAERDAVRFGRPQTALNRPARPWVIETRSCVFLDPFDRVGALSTSVLLHALANVLGRASAVWQSVHDYYGLPRFLVAGESLPTPGSIAVELRNWIGFWGKSRIREAAQTQGHVRPARGLISAANITTADFILESTSGEGAAMPGADPRRLGVDRPDASGVALGKNP